LIARKGGRTDGKNESPIDDIKFPQLSLPMDTKIETESQRSAL